jgi:hypothetical protein
MFDDLKAVFNTGNNYIINMPGTASATDLISMLANIVIGVGFSLGFIGLTMSLISLTTSHGNPDASRKAMNGIVWSVIAIVVTILAFAIKYIVLNLAGVSDQELLNARPSF